MSFCRPIFIVDVFSKVVIIVVYLCAPTYCRLTSSGKCCLYAPSHTLIWSTLLIYPGSCLSLNSRLDSQMVSCTSGQRATLPCNSSTLVSWSRFDSQTLTPAVDIYIDGHFMDGFSNRFSLSSSNSSGYKNLSIAVSTEADAGLYVCVENNGFGRSHFVRFFVTGELTQSQVSVLMVAYHTITGIHKQLIDIEIAMFMNAADNIYLTWFLDFT